MYGSAVSATDSDDAGLADGFYWLYSPGAGRPTPSPLHHPYAT